MTFRKFTTSPIRLYYFNIYLYNSHFIYVKKVNKVVGIIAYSPSICEKIFCQFECSAEIMKFLFILKICRSMGIVGNYGHVGPMRRSDWRISRRLLFV